MSKPALMGLPGWLEPLPDAAQQRALDSWAIEQGIPGLTLMERAGAGLAQVCAAKVPSGPLAVVCGGGNNGGDGLVAARLLREQGREVRVLLLGDAGALRGDARANLERLPGDAPAALYPAALAGAAGIIDAVLGTGFAGTPREPAKGAIVAINAASSVVIACDVPSGVDASTGEVAGEAVRADSTVTFHAPKPGLWIAPGKQHTGDLTVVEIGIPASDSAPADPQTGLIRASVRAEIPRRGASSNKFTAGSVLVCGGSRGLTGAPAMASMAAMRAGAGYVTVAVPSSIGTILQMKLLEVMTVELPEQDGAIAPEALAVALTRSQRVDSLVLGPGLGRDPAAASFARALAASATLPLVLDADGLNAHAGAALEELAGRSAATVLTPHTGELGRLLELDSAEVQKQRLQCAREAARRARAVVVLKGDDTIVAEPGGRVAISAGGAPALATAGTGDVLSGVVGAFLAKAIEPFTAACAAVSIHLQAGRRAAQAIGPDGVIASDVIDALPRVLVSPRRAGEAG